MSIEELNADVVVIGAGLQGLSSALWLARDGASVVVLEKESPGQHASGLNAGGVRRLGRALPEIPVAMAAHEHWQNMFALVADGCGFVPSAQIKVAENNQALAQLQERLDLLASHGYQHESLVDQIALRELLPSIAGHCIGALVVKGDGHADPMRTVRSFVAAATQAGVDIRTDVGIPRIALHDGRWQVITTDVSVIANWVVNSAGAWAGKVATLLGEPVPMRAAAFMMTRTQPVPRFVDGVIGSQGRFLSLKQLEDGAVLIGGGVEGSVDLDTSKTTLDPVGLTENMQTAIDLFEPMRKARVADQWAGIEGVLPDNLPIIGPSMVAPNLIHAFGFSGHGFQLAPEVGRIVAGLINGKQPAYPIDAFSIGRFQGQG